MNKKLLLGLFLVFGLVAGQSYASEPDSDAFDQTRENSVLESYNRAMFDFNNYFYHYLLMPVARGYRYVTTPSVRRSVRNSLDNIREPLSTGNFLLQGNLKESGITLARFAINSTLGLFGLFDVAEGWGLKKKTTGFDETFAKWCIPDGPYLVLPFIGSATPRSTVGMGLGFTLALCAMATIREVFGAASFAGVAIPFMENYKIEFWGKAPGGLLVYGLLIALIHVCTKGKAPLKTSFSCEGCPNSGNCHSSTCAETGVEN